MNLLLGASDDWIPRWRADLDEAGVKRSIRYRIFADRACDMRRVFLHANGVTIETVTAICSLMSILSGQAFILEEEQPEAAYIVVTGQFAVFRATAGMPLDRFGVSNIIGPTGFVTGQAHQTIIRALRNYAVSRLSVHDLRMAAARCPRVC